MENALSFGTKLLWAGLDREWIGMQSGSLYFISSYDLQRALSEIIRPENVVVGLMMQYLIGLSLFLTKSRAQLPFTKQMSHREEKGAQVMWATAAVDSIYTTLHAQQKLCE